MQNPQKYRLRPAPLLHYTNQQVCVAVLSKEKAEADERNGNNRWQHFETSATFLCDLSESGYFIDPLSFYSCSNRGLNQDEEL